MMKPKNFPRRKLIRQIKANGKAGKGLLSGKGKPANPGAHGQANAAYKKATNPGKGKGKNQSKGKNKSKGYSIVRDTNA